VSSGRATRGVVGIPHLKRRLTLLDAPPVEQLGWDQHWLSELERLDDDNLIPGRIAAQHRGEYTVWSTAGELRAQLSGRLFHDAEVGAPLPAVGDWTAIKPRLAEQRGTIEAVLPRRTAISRKQAFKESIEQVLAANVDVAFLLNGLDADFSLRRLERYLTTAWESGAQPVVVLTKSDLHADITDSLLEVERVAIGVPVVAVSNLTGDGVEEVRAQLGAGRTAVLLGSSGVGKSSLLNQLAGAELMRTSHLAADGTGRHTTTHRELVLLSDGSLMIDTPGLRELQLWDGDVGASFADVEELAANCRFNDCTHTHEPGCDVLAAVDDGRLELDRLRSWRKLQRELLSIAARKDRRLRAQLKRRWIEQGRAGQAAAARKRGRL
jgi:ribosome biogenesis GTPase / thiamine phosphate phosphatase